MNIIRVLYELDGPMAGRIKGMSITPAGMDPEDAPGLIVPERPDPKLHYVVAGQLVGRPRNPAWITDLILKDLPAPCAITIAGAGSVQTFDVADAEIELDFPLPGTYTVMVQKWPMQNVTFKVIKP